MQWKYVIQHPDIKSEYGELFDIEGPAEILETNIPGVLTIEDIKNGRAVFQQLINADIGYRKAKKEHDERLKVKEEKKAFENVIRTALTYHVNQLVPDGTFPIEDFQHSVRRIVVDQVWEKHQDKFKIEDGQLVFDGEKDQEPEYATELDRLLAKASVLRFGQEKPTLKDCMLRELSPFMVLAR